jgi:hypothetical protein
LEEVLNLVGSVELLIDLHVVHTQQYLPKQVLAFVVLKGIIVDLEAVHGEVGRQRKFSKKRIGFARLINFPTYLILLIPEDVFSFSHELDPLHSFCQLIINGVKLLLSCLHHLHDESEVSHADADTVTLDTLQLLVIALAKT